MLGALDTLDPTMIKWMTLVIRLFFVSILCWDLSKFKFALKVVTLIWAEVPQKRAGLDGIQISPRYAKVRKGNWKLLFENMNIEHDIADRLSIHLFVF